jgi:NTE family protein
MLFHLGALWRLNELGQLPTLDRITSVSGGSIVAAALGLAWEKLDFDKDGVAKQFRPLVVERVRRMARVTIDAPAILKGLLAPGTISDRVIASYRKYLFGSSTLQDLPARPRFIIHASNVQSKALWRFTREEMGDYRVGLISRPSLPLATAVAASSAFPPFLSPVELKLAESNFTASSGEDLQRAPFTTTVVLADGGVYDNLGLESAWKECHTVLVSDGGVSAAPQERPARDWARHSYRVLSLIDNQVRALRKRQVIGSFVNGERLGAYWGVRTDIANYHLADALPFPSSRSELLAAIPTRLAAMRNDRQEQLINWGYAVCDAGLRAHFNPKFPAPAKLPYSG